MTIPRLEAISFWGPGISDPITVDTNYRFEILAAPPVTASGKSFQFIAEALDPSGLPVPGVETTVKVYSSDKKAVLPEPYTFTTADQGQHSFTVTLQTPGMQELWLSPDDPGLAGGPPAPVTWVRVQGNSAPPPHSLPQLAWALTHSAEYYAGVVTAAYQRYLGRTPDPAGLDGWVTGLQNGLTDEQLEASFIGSAEYIANHGGPGAGWVTGMYHDLLGRCPDGPGMAGWLTGQQNGLTPSQIAYGFAASAEREAIRVRNDYQTFLGRDATAGEVNGWVSGFLTGLTNEDVIAGFVGSAEYFGNIDKGRGDPATWVQAAYQDLFGRPAGDNEVNAWLPYLT